MTEEQQGCDEFVSFSSDAYNAGFCLKLYIDGGIRSSAALVSLNKALDRPFGQVPLAVRALTFALHQDGYPVEWSVRGNSWLPVSEPKFEAMAQYRVLPKPGMPEAPVTELDADGF
ncbi:TPA: hypothetical protein ACK3Q6_005535 [Burkholderia cepacia]|jgi:hypothetical protein|uniref:Uncharacterized protein n=4 Tax=Burkholderia cepacia complex TaxID=87882 RepID=A0A250LNQ3_9BURK|nr:MULTISPECIES: hypothetical protein [Burkholderia]HDV6370807.1 hypothetical protein [Burkholderia cepacia]KKL36324.1 hypothetical protein WR31_24245 [Burkholderia contaminans LMG 23361]MBA9834805.1 hypothetical protein [Burkholderia contaminans]MBA9842726.1 hypothetical protein [Burkholderia contaminans]MBA9867491.1 hypothetical protein [Burkholderia contaminans]